MATEFVPLCGDPDCIAEGNGIHIGPKPPGWDHPVSHDQIVDGSIEWLRKNLQDCGDRVTVYSPALSIVLDELEKLRHNGD